MNYEAPVDDSHLREEIDEDVFDEMLKVRDDLLEALSPLQRAALFQEFEEFSKLYAQEISDKFYDSLT